MMILRQLMIFLAGAFCLLGFEYVLEASGMTSWGGESKKVVVITQADVRRIKEELTEKIGADPSLEQLKSAIEHAVENEILVNEALLIGLHNIDPVVRQRILLNMVFVGKDHSDDILFENAKSLGMFRNDIVVRRRLIERMKKIIASQVPDTPAKDELQTYFESAREKGDPRYQREKARRLVHGYFSTSKLPIDKIKKLYQQWVDGELSDNQIQLLADSVAVNSTVYITDKALSKLFGETVVKQLADITLDNVNNRYGGGFLPIQKKPQGYHFIRVIDVRPDQYRSYIELEKQLGADFIDEKRKKYLALTLSELRAEYDVIQ